MSIDGLFGKALSCNSQSAAISALSAAPMFIDFIVGELEIIYPNATDKAESSFNQAFGSAEG